MVNSSDRNGLPPHIQSSVHEVARDLNGGSDPTAAIKKLEQSVQQGGGWIDRQEVNRALQNEIARGNPLLRR